MDPRFQLCRELKVLTTASDLESCFGVFLIPKKRYPAIGRDAFIFGMSDLLRKDRLRCSRYCRHRLRLQGSCYRNREDAFRRLPPHDLALALKSPDPITRLLALKAATHLLEA